MVEQPCYLYLVQAKMVMDKQPSIHLLNPLDPLLSCFKLSHPLCVGQFTSLSQGMDKHNDRK